MAEQKRTGIVTRTVNYRDYDRMVTILCPEGRIDLLLRGCRKPNARLRSAGQMFCFADFELLERRPGRPIMTGCRVRDSFFALASDMDAYLAASKFAALVTELYASGPDVTQCLFALLISALTQLAYAERVRARDVLVTSALKAMEISGYAPALDFCARCGGELEKGARFSAREGGLVCAACAPFVPDAAALLPATVSTLKLALEVPQEKMAALRMTEASGAEAQMALTAFLRERLEHNVAL